MNESADIADTPRHVAVYGSLRRGHGIMPRLVPEGRLRFTRCGRIRGVLYDLGSYPGLIDGGGNVVGEIYRIRTPDVLTVLDDYEDFDPENPEESIFVRRAVPLIHPGLTAWVYFYNGPIAGYRKVPSGDWNAHKGIQA